MTDNDQRIAIAKWMGTYVDDIVSGLSCVSVLPNFVHDLNAMHETVAKLRFPASQSLWRINEMELGKIITRDNNVAEDSVSFNWECQNATAAQRAEALLRTLNLWID